LNNFYNKDFSGMEEIPDQHIDLVFTSPPYKFKDGFTYKMMEDLIEDLKRVMKPNKLIFINFGQLAHHKQVPLKVAMMFSEEFNFIDTIIWEKPQYDPVRWNKRVNNRFEYIFQFANGTDYQLDRLSIGIPYEDKSNIGRYSDIDLHCRGNIWKVGYETIQNSMQKPHPHRFPVQIPSMGIKLSGIKERSNVLDPFVGSGTSAIACKMTGMKFYGYEINPHWYEKSIERFEGLYGNG